ncbi:MAG: prepilin-type N-terminal cleavage/methylation domain-containing protein [Candidatus Binatia bacterium]
MTRRGFTLIEIMIATTILGIIMVTVYGVLARALFAKNHSEERADLYASGREAVLKIADELEGALPPTAGRNIGFIGVPGTERVPTDSVQFDVVVRRLYGATETRGGRALVSYSLDPVQNTPNLFALRRQEQLLTEAAPSQDSATDSPDAATAPPPYAFAAYILDQVAGLRLRYLNPQTGAWADSWDTTVQPPSGQPPIGLPGAVEVTLFLADNQGGVHDFGTIVDLPLANLAPPTPRGG